MKNVIEKPHNDHLPLLEASRFALALFFLLLSFSIYSYNNQARTESQLIDDLLTWLLQF